MPTSSPSAYPSASTHVSVPFETYFSPEVVAWLRRRKPELEIHTIVHTTVSSNVNVTVILTGIGDKHFYSTHFTAPDIPLALDDNEYLSRARTVVTERTSRGALILATPDDYLTTHIIAGVDGWPSRRFVHEARQLTPRGRLVASLVPMWDDERRNGARAVSC